MNTLLLTAIDAEMAATVQRLALRRRGDCWQATVGTAHVTAALTGIGRDRAISRFDALVAQRRPDRVIHFGFAGALDPMLKTGDLVEPTTLLSTHGSPVTPGQGTADDRPTSRLLTVERIIETVQEKAALFASHGVAAADMESWHVARRAGELQIPITPLRAISDDARTVLPAVTAGWVTPEGRSRPMAAAGYLALRPWQLGMLLHLQRRAKTAGERLAARIAELIAEIG